MHVPDPLGTARPVDSRGPDARRGRPDLRRRGPRARAGWPRLAPPAQPGAGGSARPAAEPRRSPAGRRRRAPARPRPTTPRRCAQSTDTGPGTRTAAAADGPAGALSQASRPGAGRALAGRAPSPLRYWARPGAGSWPPPPPTPPPPPPRAPGPATPPPPPP